MQPNKAYDEVIEFIASSSPQNVIAFRPSEEAKARVADLILQEKTEHPPYDEKSELDHYLQIEHLMLMVELLRATAIHAETKPGAIDLIKRRLRPYMVTQNHENERRSFNPGFKVIFR
jgi:hypothetical protein